MRKNQKKNRKLLISFVLSVLVSSLIITGTLTMRYVSSTPVTLSKSEDVKFPDRSRSTLQYTIYTIVDHVNFDTQIHYSIDEFANDPYARYFYIYVDEVQIFSRTFSGDVSGIVDTQALANKGTHTIKLEIYYGSYGEGCYKLNYLKIDDLYFEESGMNKIAVFFWENYVWPKQGSMTGIIGELEINSYKNKLEDNGYTTYKHKTPTNWVYDMNNLDSIEDEDDIVFIYICGHGYYDEDDDYSMVQMNQDSSSPYQNIRSDDFLDEINDLESKRIFVMVEGCYVGDFKDKLNIDGVTVITSTDQFSTSESISIFGYCYPKFSSKFFNKIFDEKEETDYILYKDDLISFRETRDYFTSYHALASFRAWHSFFGP
ncbi:MAG: hypothetical protein FK733_14090 [Asgard group archaeon]|nr:hypothetical protein [Asgard group archaeon]